MEELRGEGFVIFMMGDFNGHLGQRSLINPHGILGDTCARNQNGTLLINFLNNNDMALMNNLAVCKGTYTRGEGRNYSVVYFGMFDDKYGHLIKSFIIDENKQVAQGSDHVLLVLEINIRGTRMAKKTKPDAI